MVATDLFEKHGIDFQRDATQDGGDVDLFKQHGIQYEQPSLLSRDFVESHPLQEEGLTKLAGDLRIPELAGGALQSGEHTAASIANLPLSALNKLAGTQLKVPYVNMRQYAHQTPTAQAMFDTGQVLGTLIPGAGIYGKAAQLLKPTTVAGEIGLGAGIGGAIGGSGDDHDMRNRIIAALAGGALSGVGSLGSKAIARKVLGRKEALKKGFQKEYGGIFNDVKKSGLHNKDIGEPNIVSNLAENPNTELAYKAIPSNYRSTLEQFKENPTFENAHDAQKEMAKFVRQHKNSVESAARSATGREIPDIKYDAAELASSLRKSLQDRMEGFLAANKRGDLVTRYKQAGQRYAEEMVPYKNRAIARFEQGLTRPGKFVKELVKEERFTKPKGAYKDIQGLGTRRAMEDSGAADFLRKAFAGLGYGTGISAAIGGAGALGVPYISNLLRKAQP